MAGHGRGRPVAGEECLSNFRHKRRTVCLTKVFSDGGGGQTPMRDKLKVPLEWRRMRLVSGRSEPGPIGYFQSSRFRHRYQMVRVRVED